MTATETPPSPRLPHADPSPRVRASDAERERAAATLHEALGEGRLTLAETEERLAAAYAARYRDELPPLLADLSPPPSPSGDRSAAPAWTEVWLAAVWRVRATLLGAAGATPPTATQSRTAALLGALAVLWTIAWAFVGAGLVH